MGARLTEANYQSRRIALSGHITAATSRHLDTAYRAEMGEASTDDVAAARDAVAELEDRLAGLDAAWTRSKAEIEQEQLNQAANARRKHAATVVSLVDRRMEAAKVIEAATARLIEAWSGLTIIDQELGSVAHSGLRVAGGYGEGAGGYGGSNGGNAGAMARVTAALDHRWVRSSLAAHFTRAGYDFSDINWPSASQFSFEPATALCATSNRDLLAGLAQLAPEVSELVFKPD